MKIALLDLNHMTRGVHTNTAPLGLGFIATYLRKTVDHPFEIKIIKNPEKALKTFESWTPDILGITQYSWNSNLNIYFSGLVKQAKADCLVVAGGPNLEGSSVRRTDFLKKEKSIDICVAYDGEIPFANLVKRVLSGEKPEDIRRNPVDGSFSLEPENEKLLESLANIPRLRSLDIFSSMYADGIFDELLGEGFNPFLETHRGCPFECSFCHTSDRYYSKMLFLSPEIFRKDMEYLGKRFAGQHNVTLYITNTNMGLFKEDYPIANIIRETQEKYDWPKILNVTTGKNPKKLFELISIIKVQPNIPLQSLSPQVLENISRMNIPFEDFKEFQRNVLKSKGEKTSTELILSLPGETKETFVDGLKKVINSGVQNVVIYSLQNLKGTPLASKDNAERYGHIIKHRIVPRQFSVINGTKILDTEEVIVGTNSMPFEDYMELRGLSLTVTNFLSSDELIPLRKFMFEYEFDLARWLFNIHEQLSNLPEIYENYKAFLRETKDELFPSREALINFYNNQENYESLLSGKLGDNLLRKYRSILLFNHFEQYVELAIEEARKIAVKSFEGEKGDKLFDDMKKYLLTRDIKKYYIDSHEKKKESFSFNYDLPCWLKNSNGNKRLGDFYESCEYISEISENTNRRFTNVLEMNRDFELSLQMLYRDGTVRDFWPVLTEKK